MSRYTVTHGEHGEATIWRDGTPIVFPLSITEIGADPSLLSLLMTVLVPTDEQVEEVSTEVGEHDLITSDSPWSCSCGGWQLVRGSGSHSMHVARQYLSALRAMSEDDS